MSIRLFLPILPGLLAATLLQAQSFTVGPNGSGRIGGFTATDRPESYKIVPPQVSAGYEMRMAKLPVIYSQPSLSFNVGTDRRFGPYPLMEGTAIGKADPPFTLTGIGKKVFSVRSPSNKVYGPFSTAHKTVCRVGNSTFVVVRSPVELRVNLPEIDGVVIKRTLIGVTPVNQSLCVELGKIRNHFVTQINRMRLELAPTHYNIPRIHFRNRNYSTSNTSEVSRQDQVNAKSRAERSALHMLERLYEQRFRIRPCAKEGDRTYRFIMPPGVYLFCCMQKASPRNLSDFEQGVTRIWWTLFKFDNEHPCVMDLTGENSVDWQGVFQLRNAE